MAHFQGKYKHCYTEKVEDMYRAFGATPEYIKMLDIGNHMIDVKEEGGTWTITATTGPIVHSYKFRLGEEGKYVGMGGR